MKKTNIPPSANKAQTNTKQESASKPTVVKSKGFDAKSYQKPGLTQHQILQIKQAFDLFNVDSDGNIDPHQLQSAMISLGFDQKNVMLQQMITGQDKKVHPISFGQFLSLMTVKITEKDPKQDDIRKVFNLFDNTKSGKISVQNLRRVVNQIGEDIDDNQIQQMIERADQDEDGFVNFQQFYKVMTKSNKYG